MDQFDLVSTPDSLSTIVNRSTGISILAIDTREIDGVTYQTPVFASLDIAEKVLEALGVRSDPEPPYPVWHKALYYAAAEGLDVGIVADDLSEAAAFFNELVGLVPEDLSPRIRRVLGDQSITFDAGGRILFYSKRGTGRGISLDKVYIPKGSTEKVIENFIYCVSSREHGEIIEY